jgi:Tol biopolymer transport system component
MRMSLGGEPPSGEPLSNLGNALRNPSPLMDGQSLVVNREGDAENIVIISAIDGRELQQLTHGKSRDRGPRVAPDGRTVAFYSNMTGKYGIHTMKIDGSELRLVFARSDSDVGYPVWSPDGRHLAVFIVSQNSAIVDLSDHHVQLLPPLADPRLRFVAWSWSPDGQRILGYALREDGSYEGIYTLDLRRHVYRRIAASGWMPVWLGDDKRIAFQDGNRIVFADSETKTVLRNVRPQEPFHITGGFTTSADGKTVWLTLEREDALLFVVPFQDLTS